MRKRLVMRLASLKSCNIIAYNTYNYEENSNISNRNPPLYPQHPG